MEAIIVYTLPFILISIYFYNSRMRNKKGNINIVYNDEGDELFVSGESFDNEDGTCRQNIIRSLKEEEAVFLIPDPKNQHDKKAIKVISRNGQIGYISNKQTSKNLKYIIYDDLVSGEAYLCTIQDISGGTKEKEFLGVILLYKKI